MHCSVFVLFVLCPFCFNCCASPKQWRCQNVWSLPLSLWAFHGIFPAKALVQSTLLFQSSFFLCRWYLIPSAAFACLVLLSVNLALPSTVLRTQRDKAVLFYLLLHFSFEWYQHTPYGVIRPRSKSTHIEHACISITKCVADTPVLILLSATNDTGLFKQTWATRTDPANEIVFVFPKGHYNRWESIKLEQHYS